MLMDLPEEVKNPPAQNKTMAVKALDPINEAQFFSWCKDNLRPCSMLWELFI